MKDWLKYNKFCYAMAGDQGSGGGGQQQEPKSDGDNKQQQQQQTKDNKQNNDDSFADFWQDKADDGDEGKQTKQQQNGLDQTVDPQKATNDYLASLNFMEGVEFDKILEEFNSGNTDSFKKSLGEFARNIYKRSMVDVNTLINKRVEKAVETAVNKSRASNQGDMAVRLMNAKLEFTKDPAIAPVAKSILARSLQKGMEVDESIVNVEKYFKRLANQSAKALGVDKPPRNQPRGRFMEPDDEPEIEDWEQFLTEF